MLAAVTLFASCSQEEIVTKTDGESLVSFTVTTPELGSRAADGNYDGDGTKITKLYYAVYDETVGEIVPAISNTDKDEIEDKGFTGGTTKLELPLLNGHEYSLIFWAENEACPYTVDWGKKTITLDNATNLKSNQENYDAFYAYYAPFVVTGHKLENKIELKRPFAQLNIATSKGDLKRVVEYYGLINIAQTQVVVKTPTVMDLVTGNTSNEQELTYALNGFSTLVPAENLFPAVINAEKDEEYVAISLNYLLVNADKSLVDIKMSCDNGEKLDKEFKNVPVQRNYRTNIYGNIYTSLSDWTVDIKPEFDGGYNPAEQLAAAFEKGGEVSLHTDVELTESLILPAGKTVTLNLNGRNIINKSNTGEFGKDEAIVAYGNLTIEGEGTVQSNSMAVWARGDKNAVITINGGTFKGLKDGLAEGGRGVVYASSGNTINIEGGTFVALTADKTSFADKANGVFAALNIADNNGNINVYGGSFYKFNPAVPGTEPAAWNNSHPNGFVADGYAVKVNGDYYEIVKATEIFNGESDVTLYSNVVADATMNVASVDGQGNTVSVNTSNLSSMYTSGTLRFIQTSGDATIKNMTIDGNNAAYEKDGTNYGIRGIFLTGAGEVTIDNVTFKNVTYTMNDDTAVKTIKVTNSILEGWTSYNPQTTATFEKCTFMAGPNTNGFAPHGNTVVKDCTFNKDFKIYLDRMTTAGKTIKFVNCKYDGTLITKDNSSTLGLIEEAGTGVIVW